MAATATAWEENNVTFDAVKEYYGKVLSKSEDLKTNACCTADAPPPRVRDALKNVHEEVLSKYYGCGIVAPDELKGRRVLDLGCGSGRDVYVLAQFVGEEGSVVGVDMTQEQLDVAIRHEEYHRAKFGYAKKNTTFLHGFMERMDALGLEPGSFDVVVSNCVVNLSPDKDAVFKQVYKLLKVGGEMYFSDVYSNLRVSKELQKDDVLWGECLSGALYWNDFLRMARKHGFDDPRLCKDAPITINNKNVQEKLAGIEFYSATYRLWKLPGLLESDCEDYGQAVVYKGTIEGAEKFWDLDGHHRIFKGKVFPVCGNTWHMMASTRYAKHFDFIGNFDTHYGIFDGCGKNLPFESANGSGGGGCC